MPASTHPSQNDQLRSCPFSYYIAHQGFSNFNPHAEHAREYIENEDSDWASLGWGSRLCLLHKLPGDSASTSLWTTSHVGSHHTLAAMQTLTVKFLDGLSPPLDQILTSGLCLPTSFTILSPKHPSLMLYTVKY